MIWICFISLFVVLLMFEMYCNVLLFVDVIVYIIDERWLILKFFVKLENLIFLKYEYMIIVGIIIWKYKLC